MKLTLAQARTAMNAHGSVEGAEEFMPERAVTDSREVLGGDLFFCIKGERVDGHDYASKAVATGAAGIVAERELPGLNAPVLVVDDTVKALGRLASAHRARVSATVAGVTGTAGKTTVKELLSFALDEDGTVARNRLNLNNQIGMPVSMLAASGDERFWVMEAGISEMGDMDELGSVLRPDVGLIVNVGPGHLAGLGDVRGVARQKSRLLAHVQKNGEGLVCFDYPELVESAREVMEHVQGFSGRGEHAPAGMVCSGAYKGQAGPGGGRFELNMAGDKFELTLPWRGSFMAESLAAAAATALLMGADPERVVRGLSRATLPQQRFNIRVAKGWTVIDDSYNANPLSMARSLEAAAEMVSAPGSVRPLVLVLGEMLELGSDAERAHREIGALAAVVGADAVFWKGEHWADVAKGLSDGNYSGNFVSAATPECLLQWLAKMEGAKGVMLVKGSRGNRMEEFIKALVKETQDAV